MVVWSCNENVRIVYQGAYTISKFENFRKLSVEHVFDVGYFKRVGGTNEWTNLQIVNQWKAENRIYHRRKFQIVFALIRAEHGQVESQHFSASVARKSQVREICWWAVYFPHCCMKISWISVTREGGGGYNHSETQGKGWDAVTVIRSKILAGMDSLTKQKGV